MKRLLFALFLLTFSICNICWAQQGPYTVYPVPQQQQAVKGKASFTPIVNVVAEEGIDIYTKERLGQILQEHGISAQFTEKPSAGKSTVWLGVNGSKGKADRKASQLGLKRDVFSQPKYDRHIVSLTSNGGKAQLVVLGENTDAVFCGLATLEQMLHNGTANLPCATFYDYADVQYRGVIEGYYGVPYSMEVTEDLFRFMARYKLNMYMYGAKSDPYHSQYWDKPYPTKLNDREKRFGMMTREMMKQLAQAAHRCKVNFIWSIHPGTTFTKLGESDVLERIMSKFEKMYELGVRQFGVFVDDCGVPYDDPSLKQCADRLSNLQELVDTKWNQPGTAPADMVKQLQYVPQLYAYSWVKPELARKFWESLSPVPSKVIIYTTGKNVWSVPNSNDLQVLNDYLGREVSWWWNYPCNDVDVTKIFVADTYTNFADETHIHFTGDLEKNLSLKTIIINPMQQGELSKIPLFGVADYTWNMDSFNNMENWKASLPAVVGKNNADDFETIVPYLRYYDSLSPLAGIINDFKTSYEKDPATASVQPLKAELAKIISACTTIEAMKHSGCTSDTLFYTDLRPWLLKLKTMAQDASVMADALVIPDKSKIDLITFAKTWSSIEGIDKNENHRFDILRGMGSEITLSVQTAEPAAQSLRPFLDWLLEKLDATAQKKKKAEEKPQGYVFTTVKANPVTSTKDQYETGTCWCHAGLSFLESEAIKKGAPQTLDLAEMFVVSKSYTGRAIKYVRLDEHFKFDAGSDMGDVLAVFKEFGLVPNSVMPGLNYGTTKHVQWELTEVLRGVVEAVAKNPNRKISTAWVNGFNNVLDAYLGEIPEKFTYEGKEYTPKTYAESLNLNPDDYILFTSFTHEPFYQTMVLDVPDNWRWTRYWNIPLDEMMEIMDYAIENGYTVGWTSDMSEKSWGEVSTVPDVAANQAAAGSDEARWIGASRAEKEAILYNKNTPGPEKKIDQQMRQIAYDNKETTDDHAMHIYGIAKDQNGTKYYMVKNSFGEEGKYNGHNYVSESYARYKTLNILVNKAAVPAHILEKLK